MYPVHRVPNVPPYHLVRDQHIATLDSTVGIWPTLNPSENKVGMNAHTGQVTLRLYCEGATDLVYPGEWFSKKSTRAASRYISGSWKSV